MYFCTTQTLNINERRWRRLKSPAGALKVQLFSLATVELLLREEGNTQQQILILVYIVSNTKTLEKETWQNWQSNISEKWNICLQALKAVAVCHNAHRRYLRWCWLTGYRCRFYGKKSSSQRGVGCSAPGLGSVPHRAAPSLRASEAATCSWSGCLDGGMRMTLCGLWNGINESNLKYISIPWIILSLYSENTIFDTQKKDLHGHSVNGFSLIYICKTLLKVKMLFKYRTSWGKYHLVRPNV